MTRKDILKTSAAKPMQYKAKGCNCFTLVQWRLQSTEGERKDFVTAAVNLAKVMWDEWEEKMMAIRAYRKFEISKR